MCHILDGGEKHQISSGMKSVRMKQHLPLIASLLFCIFFRSIIYSLLVLEWVNLSLTSGWICIMFSDKQWLFHVDWRTSNSFQCGHQGSFWWASDSVMHLPKVLPTLLCFSIRLFIYSRTVLLLLFLIKSLRQADYDCGPGWLWEIISAAGSAWRDAENIRDCHLEQVC